MTYFDNAATTFPKPQEVYDGIDYAMRHYSFNAGRGTYKEAKDTFDMIEKTREMLASVVNASKECVIFSSSATEALNNIIYGLNLGKDDYVFVSPFEHNAIIRTLYKIGVKIFTIPFDKKTWELDEKALNNELFIKRPKAIIISQISNVTGFELPYRKIFELGKKTNTINVLDAAQGFAVCPIDNKELDIVVFAGHKSLYAMFGIAGYINITKVKLEQIKVGGTGSDSLNVNMPDKFPSAYEAGSINSVGVYSIFCGLNFIKNNDINEKITELTRYLINELKELDNIKIFLPDNYVSHGIVSFAIEGYSSEDVGTILSQDFDICVRTGYHCAPLVHDFINSKEYSGTIRISLGFFNSKEEIDTLINSVKEISEV